MARLFFDVAGAGFADGSTWANRAPMLVSGVCNTLVTAFDFTSDFLEVVVDPGSYVFTAAPVFTGTTVPSRNFPCSYLAGDGAGGLWEPPNMNWRSCEPAWDDSGMPHFSHTSGNLSYFGQLGVAIFGIRYTSVNTTVRVLNALISVEWCILDHNGNSPSAYIYDSAAIMMTNSVFRMKGTAYNAALTGVATGILLSNIRIEGNPAASSGSRTGWTTGANAIFRANRITIIGHQGPGINQSGTGGGAAVALESCVVYGNSGNGIISNGAALSGSRINGGLIVNNGGNGINITGTGPAFVTNTRLRNNTVDLVNVNMEQYNEVSAGTDADEFVNVAGPVSTWDLRIKNTSLIWGKGYGAGDQPAAGGGGGPVTVHPLSRSRHPLNLIG